LQVADLNGENPIGENEEGGELNVLLTCNADGQFTYTTVDGQSHVLGVINCG
jgi:hypothetical protein